MRHLRARVAKAPQSAGVYRWLDPEGTVLYVGKAKNLRSRLRSYVAPRPGKDLGPWKLSLIAHIADLDWTVTGNELEALVLETNLIKELRPKYNILMKDGKNYVYVRVTVQDPYPIVEITRDLAKDKAQYFGPHLRAMDIHRALDMVQDIVCFKACAQSLSILNKGGDMSKLRPCLDHQIGQCCGLCAGVVSPEDYLWRIEQVIRFLKGDYAPLIARAKELMKQAATEKKFEKATHFRDTIQSLELMAERQIVSDTSGEDVDVFGVALLSGAVHAVLMRKRGGKLIDEQSFSLKGRAESIAEAVEQFLPQYYEASPDVPSIVLLAADFPGRTALQELLTERKGKKVSIRVPERGTKSQLLALAQRNAQEKALQAEASWEADARNTETALQELQELLKLPELPQRIEGYDISHLGGTETVGSMVVATGGKPRNDHYRSFTIRTLQEGDIDDYQALREVLSRRLRHITGGFQNETERWAEAGITFGKALKAEEGTIKETIARYPDELSQSDISYKQFLVARHEGEIIGFVRLREHPGDITELASLWVDDPQRGQQLGYFLARLILRTLKKGKVYVRIFATLESYYASVGFRHVIRPPKLLQEKIEKATKDDVEHRDRIVMVYDALQHKTDLSLSAKPDLLVIDGGKGQLSTVVDVLANWKLAIPVIGLAKREEEIFVPDRMEPLTIPQDSPAKFLLMRLRDEAHRFANRHREKRAWKTLLTD